MSMRRTYNEEIEKRLEDAQDEFDRKVSEIAAGVRESLVVPLCRRRGFKFLSGNGVYFFSGTKRGEDVMYSDPFAPHIPGDVRRVLVTLNIEVSRGMYLGFYVQNVDLATK